MVHANDRSMLRWQGHLLLSLSPDGQKRPLQLPSKGPRIAACVTLPAASCEPVKTTTASFCYPWPSGCH